MLVRLNVRSGRGSGSSPVANEFIGRHADKQSKADKVSYHTRINERQSSNNEQTPFNDARTSYNQPCMPAASPTTPMIAVITA